MPVDYQGIYVLSSGMLLQERKLEVITNNLANVDTPAFKMDIGLVSLWDTPNGQREPDNSPENPTNNFVYPLMERVSVLMLQGPIRETGNPLDLAIEGEGFFAVRSEGQTLYTRKGNFRIDREGYLVNELGMRVLDEEGRDIRVVGSLKVAPDGSLFTEGGPSRKAWCIHLKPTSKGGKGPIYRSAPESSELQGNAGLFGGLQCKSYT
jgi:flagellar basal-body rod protein FlgF